MGGAVGLSGRVGLGLGLLGLGLGRARIGGLDAAGGGRGPVNGVVLEAGLGR
jgi:hypothetical protein